VRRAWRLVGSLFQPSKGEVVRAGERPTISFGGKGMPEYLLTPAHERRMQAILSDIAPGGGSGDEQYALPADVELVFIMAGRLEITIDEEAVVLEEGDAFTFTANARHSFRVTAESGPTRVLWVVSTALPDTTRYPS
jgi:quercetin dioxygenase-like cupin family protein